MERYEIGDKMSKFNRLQKIVIGIILAFVALGVLLKSMSGTLTSNLGYDGISMLKYALIDHPVMTAKDWLQDLANLWSVKEENDLLRYELSQNPSYKAKYDDERRKNTELEAALKLQKSEDKYTMTWAHVISRDQASWNNLITIDIGKRDGVKEGMAVESVNGMIGKVASVSNHTSVVKLLTSEDKTTTASIKINIDKKTSVDGVLQSYDIKRGMYVIYLYDDTDKVKEGMQVITSGMGGGYPSGLLIGNVDSIQALSNQRGQTIYVRPVDDFQEFTLVRVITGAKGEK